MAIRVRPNIRNSDSENTLFRWKPAVKNGNDEGKPQGSHVQEDDKNNTDRVINIRIVIKYYSDEAVQDS